MPGVERQRAPRNVPLNRTSTPDTLPPARLQLPTHHQHSIPYLFRRKTPRRKPPKQPRVPVLPSRLLLKRRRLLVRRRRHDQPVHRLQSPTVLNQLLRQKVHRLSSHQNGRRNHDDDPQNQESRGVHLSGHNSPPNRPGLVFQRTLRPARPEPSKPTSLPIREVRSPDYSGGTSMSPGRRAW